MSFVKDMTKLSAVLVLTLFLVSLTEGGSYDIKYGRHNITHGFRKYGDRLLFFDNAIRPSSFLRVLSTDVEYPPRGQKKNITMITYFRITDQIKNTNGGYAFINNGGVGYTYLSVHLKSQRSQGYNFTIEIYGYPLYPYKK